MAKLAQKLSMDQLQTKWASQLNPVLANLLVQGQLLQDQSLINGTTTINHRLGRTLNGWFVVSPKASATVYEATSQPNPTLTLTLISSAALDCSIWVF
jgi:hypothetical protein